MEQLQEVMLRWSEIFQLVAVGVALVWFWVHFEKQVWQGLSVPLLLVLVAFGYDVLMNWRF